MVEHFYIKFQLEEHHLQSSNLNWLVIRPVGFIELLPPPGIRHIFFSGAMYALIGNTNRKYIACKNIIKDVIKALLGAYEYTWKTLTIAGQVTTLGELQAALKKEEWQKG